MSPDSSATANCLILTPAAAEYVALTDQLAEGSIQATPCTSVDDVLSKYDGETVLFGNPALIAEVIGRMPAVDWVQSTWAGVTPLIDAERRDYVLTGVKDVFGPQMSEYVFGYLLAHELRILDRVASQAAHAWDAAHSGVLAGKTIGVLGTGSIGQHLARTAAAFDMRSVGLSRSGAQTEGFDDVFATEQLSRFLQESDYLVSTLPDTPETRHLLNRDTLAELPEGAYFVNVGRSNVIDDVALIAALQSGQLAGAALDVFDEEPVPEESPLWEAPNLRMTGHIAAISHPALIVPIFIENHRRYLAGEPLNHVIDFDAGY